MISGEISEEELRRLLELMGKYGIQTSDEEMQRIREAEDRYGMNEIEESRNTEKDENFAELPPVEVMNRLKTPEKEEENVFEKNL